MNHAAAYQDLSTDALGEQIAEDIAHLDAARHRVLTKLRIFDDAGGWAKQGFRSCSQWLSWRVGFTRTTAREHVRVANALAPLPAVDEALRLGRISYSKVRAITRVANPANEATLLEQALLLTGSQLDTLCSKFASVQDHDGAAPRPRDDADRRHVTRRDTADGMVRIEACLHPEEAALVWTALDRIATQACRASDAHDRTGQPSSEPKPHGPASAEAAPASAAAHAVLLEQPLRDRTGQPSPDRTGQPSPDRTGQPSPDRTGQPSPDRSGQPSPDRTGQPSPDRSGQPSPILKPHGAASAEAAPQSAVGDEAVEARAQHTTVVCAPEAHAAGAVAVTGSRGIALEGARRPPAFSRADALVTMAQEIVRGHRPHRAPTELVISIPLEALQRTESPAMPVSGSRAASGSEPMPADASQVGCCAEGTAISSACVRRLACDSGLVAVLEDAQGNALAVGRKLRSISGALKRALLRRDQTCRFPGCRSRVLLEAHHIKHWANGGETVLSNLLSTCAFHHRFLHEYGFTIELREDGTVTAYDPAGREIHESPAMPCPVDLGWPNIERRNTELAITAESIACWDGTPVDYGELVSELFRSEERTR